MRDHLSIEDLSGYFDDDVRDPEEIKLHLEECPPCAEKHDELSKVLGYLRSLPEPEVHPAFATRVVAAIEEREARRRPILIRLAAPVAAIALVLLSAAVFFGLNSTDRSAAPISALASLPSTLEDEILLLEEIERLVAENPSSSSLLMVDIVDEVRPPVAPADEMLMALADPEWFSGFAESWVEEEDFESAVSRLNEDETQNLKRLLREYAIKAGAL